MSRRTPPNNRQAEESLLGAMLVSVNAIEVAAGRGLEPDDFYTVAHTHIYEAILRLHCKRHPDIEAHVNVADPETVSAELGKLLDECGGIGKLRQLQANAPSTGNALTYVRRIEKCKTLRDLLAAAGQIAELSYDEPDEVDEALERARAALRQVEERLPVEVPSGLMPLDDLLEWAEEQGEDFAPWLIDDLIKRQWRVLVVALPGSGKSTFLRQVAIAAAAGLHPFTNAMLPQQLTVLIIDLENPVEHIVTIARPMRDGAASEGEWVHRKHCHVWHRPDGIDLTTHRGRADLEAAIRSVKPDLVAIGPAYKLANTDGANGNDVDAQVMTVLDTLRVRHDFGLMIETHPPHSDGMRLRVKGSSRWLNWPEIGLALTQIEDDDAPVDGPLTFELKQFRPGRLPTNWPKMVRHSRGKVDGWRPWVADEEF